MTTPRFLYSTPRRSTFYEIKLIYELKPDFSKIWKKYILVFYLFFIWMKKSFAEDGWLLTKVWYI